VTTAIALVGAGPRAVAIAARLVADHRVLTPGIPLVVHLVDAVEVGAGRTWRRDQHPLLLNNSYCAETTVFADETVPTAGPVEAGPSLAEWARDVAAEPDGFDPWVAREAVGTQPWSFPSRRFHGAYFRWALDRVIASAPEEIAFVEHVGLVAALQESATSRQLLVFTDGRRLEADVAVLVQGLLTSDGTVDVVELTAEAQARGLTYLAPGMPTERDWDRVRGGEPVLIRGLGATFFDVVGLLFEGRGGRFVRGSDGELSYRPTGSEPRVIAGSRHGLPYRAKAYYATGLPEPIEPTWFSAAREAELLESRAGRADVDFGRDLADHIAGDFRGVFETAARRTGSAERFDWASIVHPAAPRQHRSDTEWRTFLDRYFADELFRIRHPTDSPHKAVHRAMETVRRRISRLVLAQVFDPGSVVRDIKQTLMPQSLVLASGPPPERLEQLVALRRAGVIEILGPELSIEVTADGFRATTAVPGQRRTAATMAEARMTLGDLRSTDDPLMRSMIGAGQARLHRVRGRDQEIETSTLDVTGDQFLLVDASGRPHPRRLVVGSPAGDVQWYSAIGAIPRTGDKFLVGADRVAAYALRVAAGGHPTF
jgi:hypothetical protein